MPRKKKIKPRRQTGLSLKEKIKNHKSIEIIYEKTKYMSYRTGEYTEIRCDLKKQVKYFGNSYLQFIQKHKYSAFVFLYFDNGWTFFLTDDINTSNDVTKIIQKAKNYVTHVIRLYEKYQKITITKQEMLKYIDYAVYVLFKDNVKLKLHRILNMMYTYFEPTYAYYIDLVAHLYPMDLTNLRNWYMTRDFSKFIMYKPDLTNYVPVMDLSHVILTGNKRTKYDKMPYEDFKESISHLSDDEVMELITKYYDYEVTESFYKRHKDVRKIFYRLTNHYLPKHLNNM